MISRFQSEGEEIDDRAAEWLAQRGDGLSPAQAAEFSRWREADPRHEAAIRRLEATHAILARLPETPAAEAMLRELDKLTKPVSTVARFPRWAKIAASLAAAAAVALLAWPHFYAAPNTGQNSFLYATETGSRKSVDLPDGSTLALSGGSEVQIEFLSATRKLQLNRGEAHFSVAKDADRPFLVSAGTVTVRAVGTAFTVRRESASVEVIVTEGKVRVTRDDLPAGAAANSEPMNLVAGDRAVIDTSAYAAGSEGAKLTPVVIREKLTWQTPRMVFSNTPLSEVVERFNRYSRVQLEIADQELADRPVGGSFDATNAESFAKLLSASGDVTVTKVSETKIVLSKGR